MSRRFVSLFALGLLSCADRLTPLNVQWDATVAEVSKKALALSRRQQALQTQYEALPILDDAKSVAVVGQRKWLERFREAADEVGRLEQVITLAEAQVRKARDEQSIEETENVIAEQTRSLLAERQQATSALDALDAAFSSVRAAVLEASQAEKVAVDRVPAWVRNFRRVAKDGGALDVHDLVFINGKPELDAKSAENQKGLQALAAAFKECKKFKVKVTGHTSQEGDPKANERLSLARADAVRKNLIAKGVKKEMLKVAGAGGRQPLVPEPMKEAEAKVLGPIVLDERRQMNRRMTFEVVSRCQ